GETSSPTTSAGGGVQQTWTAPSDRFNCPSLKTSNVGINQSATKYFTTQVVFADLMKHSAGWRRPFSSPNTATPLQLDQDGYPTVIDLDNSFINIIHDDLWGRDSGTDNIYVLLYDGEGTFSLNISNTIIDQAPGRIVYRINAQGRIILSLNTTNPANHARNIRFVSQSDESTYTTQPFRQEFLATWGSFPVTRYMDWLETNNSTVTNWADRTLPTSMMQSFGAGVAYEYIIQLSNYTQTNPWINIPHLASDDYVSQLATLFKNTLDPNLTVYVEYTNEAWNFGFSQTQYMISKASELGLPAYYSYFSQRSSEVMDIWSNVYLNIPKSRYVRVLGTQSTNIGVTERIVSWGNAFEHHDALAVAPYFGGKLGRLETEVNLALTMTAPQLAQYLLDVELPINKTTMVAQKTIADTNGLRLIAYEAGQHLAGAGNHPTYGNLLNYQPLTDLFIATNREPLMKDIYIQYMKNWKEVSGDLMVLFTSSTGPSKFGSWGLLEYGTQALNLAPKANGVYESICGAP
ncbi:MAG: hypothetical protein QM504_07705, partial [Pseudomonadota bacterium]